MNGGAKSVRTMAIVASLTIALAVVAIYFTVIVIDRRIHVVFQLPSGYRGFFAIVFDPRRRDQSSAVNESGTWRDRQITVAVPDDGIVIINDDHFLRFWHRVKVCERGNAVENALDDSDAFFTAGDTNFEDSGRRVYWMFYGTKSDYSRQRNLRALDARISEN